MKGLVYQINVKPEATGERGIPKLPTGSVNITITGVSGDYNKYRTEEKQGNPDKAVLLIPLETLDQLKTEGWPVEPGDLGENITSSGVSYDFFVVGQRYTLGTVEIEITEPCTPCGNLKVLPYVGKERKASFVKTLLGRRGWYAKVLVEGKVKKGDNIKKVVE